MYDPGYKNYQYPRLQPPEEPERECCGDCDYYREVSQTQRANGLAHCIGCCVLEIFQASTFKKLAEAELVEVDPADEPCRDYRKGRD